MCWLMGSPGSRCLRSFPVSLSRRVSGSTSSMAPPPCPLGSQPVVSLRPWNTQAQWDARGSPCRLTWAEHGDAPPPAPGTRMDTGHLRVTESRGLVCRCELGVSRKQRGRERQHTPLPGCLHVSPGLLHELPERSSYVYLGAVPRLTCLFPTGARMTLRILS